MPGAIPLGMPAAPGGFKQEPNSSSGLQFGFGGQPAKLVQNVLAM